MSFQTTAENSDCAVCRRDVIWQTVPDSWGGNRESSVDVRPYESLKQPIFANRDNWMYKGYMTCWQVSS